MAQTPNEEYGVTLSDIFWNLWQWRGVIFIVPIIFAALGVLVVVFSSLGQDRQISYLVNLRNIDNQSYPNGTQFSPQDLLIPEVLTRLRERFNIPADVDVRAALSVFYDSPLSDGISKKYQQRLAARNLTQAEIDALNQSYLAELRDAMRTTVRINVDYQALGLDRTAGLALAAELPQLWTEIYTTKYRIFTDRRVADLAVSRSDENLATTASVIVVNARVKAMERGLNTLLNDNRLSVLKSVEGLSAADVLVELGNFRSVWFNLIKAQSLRGTDVFAKAYLDGLHFDIEEKKSQIQAFDATLSGLGDYQRSGKQIQVDQNPAVPVEQGNQVQLGDNAFSGIVQLAQQASFANFVQRVLDERRNHMDGLASLEKERDQSLSASQEIIISPQMLSQASQLLKIVTTQYSQLVDRSEELLRDRAGDLYQPLLGPVISGTPLVSALNFLIVAAATLGGGLLAIIGALVAGAIRRRKPV